MSTVASFAAVDPEFAQLRRLTEISRALTYTTSLEQVTRLTVERGTELVDGTAAVLMLADSEGLLNLRAAHGVSEERFARFEAPLTDEVIGRLQGLLAVPGDRFVAVPLVVGGAVTGLLAVSTREATTEADETILTALADQAAVAIENARVGGEVRVEMEGRLRDSEGAASAKDRALSTLAHDIRSPLGAIDGYCAILEEEIYGPVNDRQRETLGRVRMSGRHLLALLDNVMEMARLTAGVSKTNTEQVDLVAVAREAVHLMIPAADARLQTLQMTKAADVVVSADHDRLRQVLVNLLGNAVKFTPPDGSVTVTVSKAERSGGIWGEIRVSDSGPGIPQEDLKAIFEPYYRSDGTASLPGVGLGLAISQGLVRQMGGELSVESAFGEGATFIIRIPAPGPEAADPTASAPVAIRR